MRKEALRNILAAVGLVVICVVALAIFISIFTGGGVTGDKVAVVDIAGVITDPYEVNKTLRELGERDDVKAVVIRIESPGGAVGPSQEIHREIQRLRKKRRSSPRWALSRPQAGTTPRSRLTR